ncbi:MAG: Lrp/AsnC family transcriptional regulator [Actinomycetota bacterium]
MTPGPVDLDATDWSILHLLQDDGRMSFRNLAKAVHLSPAATTARVHAMEAAGIIRAYRAEVDAARTGRPTKAFVRLTAAAATTRSVQAAERIGRDHPAVRQVFLLLGDADLLFYVEAADLQELDALVTDLGSFGQTATSLVVDTLLTDHRTAPPDSA